MLAALGVVLVLFAMILHLTHVHGDIQWWLIAIAIVAIGLQVLVWRGPRWYHWAP